MHTVEVEPVGLSACANGSLRHFSSVSEGNPFAVVSLPVDSYVCDRFCTTLFLGMFRDFAFRTFPPIFR